MTIKIPQETCTYVQRLHYELNGLRQRNVWLMSHIDTNVTDEWRDKKLEEATKECQLISMEYQMALDEIRQQYVPEEYRTDEYQMDIDYIKNEVRIYARSTSC